MSTKRHTVIGLLLLAFLATSARAQTLDDFMGDAAVSCPAPPHQVTATCSQASGSTTQTCTVPTGDGVNYGTNEPIMLLGSGTSLDYVFNGTTAQAGTSYVSNIIGDTLTLTAPSAAATTLTNVSVTLQPGHYYVPVDGSGNPVAFTTPWGSRTDICTPEGHWFWDKSISGQCVSLTSDSCAAGPTTSSANTTRASNVATLTIATASYRWNVGQPIQVTNCTDTTYDVTGAQVLSLSSNGLVFTYSDPGTNDSTGTTNCKIEGYGWNPPKYAGYGGSEPDTRCNTQLGEMARYVAIGFNSTGEDSDLYAVAGNKIGCTAGTGRWYPVFTGVSTPAASRYPGVNLWGQASQPVKIPVYTIIPSITGFSTARVQMDWADPHWLTWMDTNWNQPGRGSFTSANYPWMIATVFDDTDNMQQTHATGLWHTAPPGSGFSGADPALLTLYSAPQITTSNEALYTNAIWTTPLLYPDSAVYTKDLAATPPPSCPETAPCSLADTLRIEYGTIAALNAAWGTSYTTFGSTQTVYTNQTVSTPSSYPFNTNVTPRSVEVCLIPSAGTWIANCESGSANGVMVAGDCALGAVDCPAGTAGTAQFLAPPSCFNGGTANYYQNTGIVCTDPNGDIEQVTAVTGLGQTGTAAPSYPANTSCSGSQTTVTGLVTFTCVGPKITGTLTYSTGASAFTVGGSGTLSETLSVNYTTGGWHAGGKGLEDEDGTGASGVGITVTNGLNLVCPQTYATGISVTAYETEVAFQITGANYWAFALTSGTTSDPAPAFSVTQGATITGSDGIRWEMLGTPVSDASNGDFRVACPAYNPVNAKIASDLHGYDQQFFNAYYGGLGHVVRTNFPGLLNFGVNYGMLSYNAPTWKEGLIAANEFTDGAFVGSIAALQTPTLQAQAPLSKLTIDYITDHFHRPIITEPFMGSCNGDWQGYVHACGGTSFVQYPGLTARANGWYTIINNELTYTAPNGVRPFTGIAWWTDHNNDNGSTTGETSFALLDFMDNRLDGHENVTASVPCSPPLAALTCGGEVPGLPWLGVDEEHITQGIDAGFSLPYSGPPSGRPTAPSKRVFIWGQ